MKRRTLLKALGSVPLIPFMRLVPSSPVATVPDVTLP